MSERLTLGVRIATGNNDNPVSTNDTFGDAFTKDSIGLDRAFLKWSWQPIEEKMGRFAKRSRSLEGVCLIRSFLRTWYGIKI